MLGALLKQVVLANPVRCHSIIKKLQAMKKKGDSLGPESALTFLVEALQQFNSSYICIDALDECNKKHQTALLRSLNGLFGHPELRLRIFLTGRPHVEEYVRNNLTGPKVCKMVLEATKDDISKYIKHHMDSDNTMSTDFKEEILAKITASSDGMSVPPIHLYLDRSNS